MLQEQQEADREEKPRHNPDSSPAQFLGARDRDGEFIFKSELRSEQGSGRGQRRQ